VSFSNVVFSELVEADVTGPGGVCGFPPFYNVGFPNCLPLFLNSDHPKQGYEHAMFRFRIDADLDDETLFPPGQRVKYMGSGAITIYLWNSFEPLTADDPFPYHTVTVHLAHMCTDGDKGYYITKLDDGTWELNLEGQTFDITQSYTWKEVTGIGKNKKPIISITSYAPQSGLADVACKFIIIKNPK